MGWCGLEGPVRRSHPQLVTLNIAMYYLPFFIVVLRVSGGSQRPGRVPKCGGAPGHHGAASVQSGRPQRSVHAGVGAREVWNSFIVRRCESGRRLEVCERITM